MRDRLPYAPAWRLGALLGALTLLAPFAPAAAASASTSGAPQVVAPTPAGATTPELAAQRTARTTNHPVRVDALTTPTQKVEAQPDGGFTAELSAVPVRARNSAGRWARLDTTLRRQPDGTVAPANTGTRVAFSGGGSGPLVTIGRPTERVALSWPGRLPTPTLKGSVATYADVLPGVDLQLTATSAGYAEALVVRNRAAAANPALRHVRFGLHTEGLRTRAARGGGFDAVDASGAPVFTSPGAEMWDAHGRHEAHAGLRVSPDSVELTPDLKFLSDPATDYPVTIDPDASPGRVGWTKVFSGKSTSAHWNGGNDVDTWAKVGYCGWDWCNGIGKTESFFAWDLSDLDSMNAIVTSAEVDALEVYAPSCTPQGHDVGVTLVPSNSISSSTTWATKPKFDLSNAFGTQNAMYGYSSSCPARSLGWEVGGWLKGLVNSNAPTATVGLVAHSEGDAFGWKLFDPKNTVLVVHFDRLPTAPTALDTLDVPVSYGCGKAIPTATPTLRAKVYDADGESLPTEFEWFKKNGPMIGYKITSGTSSGGVSSAGVPAGQLHDGDHISWRARAKDRLDWGPFSAWCDFTVDLTGPGAPPGISSDAYPPDVQSGGVGVSGTFTFTAGGVADVTGYYYGTVDGEPQDPVATTTPGGSATVSITPADWGPQRLFVESHDAAGHRSPRVEYDFFVGQGTPPAAYWPLNGYDTATSSPDTRGHSLDIHGVNAGATWTTGVQGDALQLNGTSAAYATAAGPRPVDTARNFSISAWARLDKVTSSYAAVASMDGVHSPGFQLQATPGGKWAFVMAGQDVDGGGTGGGRIESTAPITVGAWTHLAGTYDASTHQMRLYVNGALAAPVGNHTSTWSATGPVTVGRSLARGAYCDFFPGALDDVRVYDRVLAVSETSGSLDNVHDLATQPIVPTAYYPFDDGAGTLAADAATSVRPATLAGGATWTAGNVGTGAVQLGGAAYLTATGDAVHTENSFSVAARAQLPDLDDANHVVLYRPNGFSLGYDGGSHTWAFAVYSAASKTWTTASGPADSATTGWSHLVGVYDAAGGELLLYVNGRSVNLKTAVGAPAVATGDLQIGRALPATGATGYWSGAIDDVHTYVGAMTVDQVRDLRAHPVLSPATPYTGELTRWLGHRGNHLTSATGIVPTDFHLGTTLGVPAPEGAADTHELFSCRNSATGTDFFTSASATCEGALVIGPIAAVYDGVDDASNLRPLYRCTSSQGHFDSVVDGCEGATTEGTLGYVVGLRALIRYASPVTHDHFSTFMNVPADYHAEGSLGFFAAKPDTPDTVPLFGCVKDGDNYSSTDSGCGDGQLVYYLGSIWTSPPSGAPAPTLHACRITQGGERFDSVDPTCEGQTDLGQLGYLTEQS